MDVAVKPAPEATEVVSARADTRLNSVRLRRAASNLGVALLFFVALIPGAAHFGSGIANTIWFIGAGWMGLLSLVRVPPNSSTITASSIVSTAAMMLLPAMMRPAVPSAGLLRDIAVVVELVAVAFSQVSRVYLGRRFGLLPANRGIVSTGPFRLMRHPIYVGWLVLLLGYAMAFPSALNFVAIAAMLPFMMWRITLEEELLTHDPEYRAYCEQTRYRLVPGVF
jgi:protein-S-isoprenylcysteine O-methyltransferase Ste14